MQCEVQHCHAQAFSPALASSPASEPTSKQMNHDDSKGRIAQHQNFACPGVGVAHLHGVLHQLGSCVPAPAPQSPLVDFVAMRHALDGGYQQRHTNGSDTKQQPDRPMERLRERPYTAIICCCDKDVVARLVDRPGKLEPKVNVGADDFNTCTAPCRAMLAQAADLVLFAKPLLIHSVC